MITIAFFHFKVWNVSCKLWNVHTKLWNLHPKVWYGKFLYGKIFFLTKSHKVYLTSADVYHELLTEKKLHFTDSGILSGKIDKPCILSFTVVADNNISLNLRRLNPLFNIPIIKVQEFFACSAFENQVEIMNTLWVLYAACKFTETLITTCWCNFKRTYQLTVRTVDM